MIVIKKDNPVNYVKEFADLAKGWIDVGVSTLILDEGTELYSGQWSNCIDEFKYSYNMDMLGLGIWLSEDLNYAKTYCYYNVRQAKGRFVFRLKTSNQIKVLVFPVDFHPAKALGDIDVIPHLSNDKFVSRYWDEIVKELVKQDKELLGVKGHIREADTSIKSDSSEFWFNDKNDLELIEAKKVPDDLQTFTNMYGSDVDKLPSRLFKLT